MSLAVRGAPLAALIALVLLTGCGGSVADSDAPAARPTRDAPTASADPFCEASRANADAIGPLNALVSTGSPDRQELARAVDAVRRAGADLLQVAPPEIRGDVEQTVDAVDVQLDALLANGGDGRAIGRDPAVASRLNSPELAAASERLTSYVTRTCGATRR